MAEFGVIKGGKDKKLLPLRSANDCSEYVAVIRDIPPNLLRPMIKQLAGIAPNRSFMDHW